MALTKSRNVDHFVDQELRTYPVKAATKIYRGAIVGLDTAGFARGLVAGDHFVGVAYEEMDNSAGAAGDKVCRVSTLGDFEHALTGAVAADRGRPVFASADDTLTFVSLANSYVGVVQDLIANGTIILRIDPDHRLVKTIVHAHWIIAARVVNQATAAAGIDASNTCVVALAINAGAVATETFDATPAFPAANAVASLGTITNPHANPGDVLTLAVTDGTTADPGPFLVEVDYV
jgi:hypothetical protein